MRSSSETPCELGHTPLTFLVGHGGCLIIVRFLRDRLARPWPPVRRTRSRRHPIELNRGPPRGRYGNLTSAAGVSVVSGPDARAGAAAERTRSTAVTATDRPRNMGIPRATRGGPAGVVTRGLAAAIATTTAGGPRERPCRKRAGSVHELSCQAQDWAGDERGTGREYRAMN